MFSMKWKASYQDAAQLLAEPVKLWYTGTKLSCPKRGTGRKAARSLKPGGTSVAPRPKGRGGGPMAIVSLICSLVSTGCAVFSAVFSIYMYHQQHHNDDKKK